MDKYDSIRPPKDCSLTVMVRIQPISLPTGKYKREDYEDILREVADRMVVVLDPDHSKRYLDTIQNRTKEKKFTFDRVFDKKRTNREVFEGTLRGVMKDTVNGINATVFAYGATGSGKTHTMVGHPEDPGLMVLALDHIFVELQKKSEFESEVTCSYLEVYNEIIYDLLVPRSAALDLREDPRGGVHVAGLKTLKVQSSQDMLKVLDEGNKRRKTESTKANATSSRSHAVLEIVVQRTTRNQVKRRVLTSKLAMVDLAGSERAAETGNTGAKMRDGANINKSLLALANCINALGKQAGGGVVSYVPFRNSKLTRLLKDGLVGNCRTCMVATVSSTSRGYQNTINTLKYADRAKEIKTQVTANVGSVESHVAEYQRMINELQEEVSSLREELSTRVLQPQTQISHARWEYITSLLEKMKENADENYNLQQELFEHEDFIRTYKWDLSRSEHELSICENAMHRHHLTEKCKELSMRIEATEESKAGIEAGIARMVEGRKKNRDLLETQMNETSQGSEDDSKKESKLMGLQQQLLTAQCIEMGHHMLIKDRIITVQREALKCAQRLLARTGVDYHRIMQIAEEESIEGADKLLDYYWDRPDLESSRKTVKIAEKNFSFGRERASPRVLDDLGAHPLEESKQSFFTRPESPNSTESYHSTESVDKDSQPYGRYAEFVGEFPESHWWTRQQEMEVGPVPTPRDKKSVENGARISGSTRKSSGSWTPAVGNRMICIEAHQRNLPDDENFGEDVHRNHDYRIQGSSGRQEHQGKASISAYYPSSMHDPYISEKRPQTSYAKYPQGRSRYSENVMSSPESPPNGNVEPASNSSQFKVQYSSSHRAQTKVGNWVGGFKSVFNRHVSTSKEKYRVGDKEIWQESGSHLSASNNEDRSPRSSSRVSKGKPPRYTSRANPLQYFLGN